jgi:Asp-tRNA(Asn)/Glu-tRNA(Gln) amidotransferase A subunit family amidase
VAAGVGFFSLGTDTGGSVRIPAALNRVLGLKPTFGRTSRHGVVPLSSSLDTVGVLARGTNDVTEVLGVLCRSNGSDSSGAPDVSIDPAEPRLDGTRIGLPREILLNHCDADVRESFPTAVRLLEGLGARVEEISLPWGLHAPAVVNLITWAESAALHRDWFAKRAAAYGRHMRDQILIGSAPRCSG